MAFPGTSDEGVTAALRDGFRLFGSGFSERAHKEEGMRGLSNTKACLWFPLDLQRSFHRGRQALNGKGFGDKGDGLAGDPFAQEFVLIVA